VKVDLSSIVSIIEDIAPPSLAESWDACDLLLGNPTGKIEGVLVSLEPSRHALKKAAREGLGLVVSHHPHFLKSPERILTDREPGKSIAFALAHGLSLYSAHTSFDWAPGGMNDALASLLGLTRVGPLRKPDAEDYCKLVTFVPEDHVEQVARAVFSAGGGVIGEYTHCAFRHPGTGSFLPADSAEPFSGRRGELSYEPEMRLEVRVPRSKTEEAIRSMIRAHPYEEPAYDLYALAGAAQGGIGRIGAFDPPLSSDEFIGRVKEVLDVDTVRVTARLPRRVSKLALCTGGGRSLIPDLAGRGKLVYLTGEIDYHGALQADALGIPVVEVGHWASEIIFVDAMADRLKKELSRAGLELKVVRFKRGGDPFTYL